MNRQAVERVLIKRCGAAMDAAGLDGTQVGSNTDLNDPLRYALRRLGFAVADISLITDEDIAAVGADDEDALLDLAELRMLETTLNAATGLVDITVGPRRESLGQLATHLQARVDRLRESVKQYGTGGSLEGGYIGLSFQEDGTVEY